MKPNNVQVHAKNPAGLDRRVVEWLKQGNIKLNIQYKKVNVMIQQLESDRKKFVWDRKKVVAEKEKGEMSKERKEKEEYLLEVKIGHNSTFWGTFQITKPKFTPKPSPELIKSR